MFTFKKILHCTFGKISNGLLFIVIGFASAVIGITCVWPIAIICGSVSATLGVVLAFIRESRYCEAVSDVAKLRFEQGRLKESIYMLRGRVQLLRNDLTDAQQQISDLRSMRIVDIGDSKYATSGKSGPAFDDRRYTEF